MGSNQFSLNYFSWIEPFLSEAINSGIKELLETKHLYQKYTVLFPEFPTVWDQIKEYFDGVTLSSKEISSQNLSELYELTHQFGWRIKGSETPAMLLTRPPYPENVNVYKIPITPPTIRIFCSNCDGLQPYNYIGGEELLESIDLDLPKNREEQIFSFVYQCQLCKGFPEVFLVRKNKDKIYICGRAPMEEVIVSGVIPRSYKKYFSDAIVAFNSGAVLAANFLLRTFIEQYVRATVNDFTSRETDVIFSKYASQLTNSVREQFPSLKKIYDDLSDDIHGAIGSVETFTNQKQKIETHFEAKRLYEKIDSRGSS